MKVYEGERLDSQGNIVEGLFISTLDDSYFTEEYIADPNYAQLRVEQASDNPYESKAKVFLNGKELLSYIPDKYIKRVSIESEGNELDLETETGEIIRFNPTTGYVTWRDLNRVITEEKIERQTTDNFLQFSIEEEQRIRTSEDNLINARLDEEIRRREISESELKYLIDSERARAINAEQFLNAKIDSETLRAINAETDIYIDLGAEAQIRYEEDLRLERRIDSEAQKRRDSEALFLELLRREIKRAKDSEAFILAYTTENLNREIQRAQDSEAFILDRLSDEVIRALTNETRIETKLDDEIQRAKDSEAFIIDCLVDEIIRAQDSEAFILNELDGEVSRSVGFDNIIQSELNTEITRAKNEERAIRFSVIDERVRAKDSEAYILNELAKEITRATNSEGSIKQRVINEVKRAKDSEAYIISLIIKETNRAKSSEGYIINELNKEITRAKNSEGALKIRVDKLRIALDSEATRAKTKEQDLDNRLTAESNTRYLKDSELEANLNAEIKRAQDSEAVIKKLINDNVATINANLSTEILNRTTGDNTLRIALTSEATYRKVEDDNLKAAIDYEISRAKGREDTLETRLENEVYARTSEGRTLKNRIKTEEDTRLTGDTALSGRIDTEVSARTSRDAELTIAINDEVTARGNADTALSNRIDNKKDIQTPVSDPAATGTATNAFISSISQDAQGVITVVKSPVSLGNYKTKQTANSFGPYAYTSEGLEVVKTVTQDANGELAITTDKKILNYNWLASKPSINGKLVKDAVTLDDIQVYDKSTVDSMIAASSSVLIEPTLPSTPRPATMYYIGPKLDSEGRTYYDVYYYDSSSVGHYMGTTDINLLPYQKKSVPLSTVAQTVEGAINELHATKQANLTAGTNISIATDGTISAVDHVYTAGTGIKLSSGQFSNTGVLAVTQDKSNKRILYVNTNGISSTITIPDDKIEYKAGTNVSITADHEINVPDMTYNDKPLDNRVLALEDRGTDVWDNKQDKLTAGANITIASGIISASDMTYDDSSIKSRVSNIEASVPTWNAKQNALTAGPNITISGNTISSTNTDTHYTNSLTIQGNGTTATTFSQNSDKTLNIKPGSNVSISTSTNAITINSSYTDTKVTAVGNHYTPSGGTSTTPTSSGTATRGSTIVMTGITKDAAGHITGVTGYTLPASDNTDTKVTAVGNHYTPVKSTTKSASGATGTAGNTVQVVTGLEMDATGHVTGVVSGAATDTRNTAGASNKTGTKLFLVGATSQADGTQTYSNSNVYIGTDNNLYSAGDGGKVATSLAFTVTLTVAGWSSKAQTISDSRLKATGYSYIVSPSGSSFTAYAESMVYADDVTSDGSIKFHCDTVPTSALTVSILRLASAT